MAGWLGIWMLIASLLSSFALFLGNTTVYTRSLWSMGRADMLDTQSYLPQQVGLLWERYNTPWVAILVYAVTTTLLMSFSFEVCGAGDHSHLHTSNVMRTHT
jgi:amino acid transporter